MKTISLIAFLFCVTNLSAQTNNYTVTKVFNEGEFSYQCNVSPVGNVELYNTANNWIGIDQKIKETNLIFASEDAYTDLITDESWRQNRTESRVIMRNALSGIDEVTLERGGTLYVNFFVNTETGDVDDVRFTFDRDSCFVYLPISFFRQLELAFKENCQYVLTDFAESLNYVYQWNAFKL